VSLVVASPLSGAVVALDLVDDPVFADRVVGEGVAVRPDRGEVIAPVTGRVEKLFPGGHGIALVTAGGVEILVHIGIETVRLEGDGFTVLASEGADVEAGEPLVRVDLDRLRELGVDPVSPVVVMSDHPVRVLASGRVEAGDALLGVGA
jgi:glucose-specific phosphotransferase system IIA component